MPGVSFAYTPVLIMRRKKRNEALFNAITPDEIFLDSKNMPEFDKHQFEGKIEKPITSRVFLFSGVAFLVLSIILLARIGYLQTVEGEVFAERAKNNHLRLTPIPAERGLIYDRNGELLSWNSSAFYLVLDAEVLFSRYYDYQSGLDKFLNALFGDNQEKKSAILNRLKKTKKDLIVAIFYDWNEINEIYRQWEELPLRIEPISLRAYKNTVGLAHAVGYVGYPSADELKNIEAPLFEEMIGKSGAEKEFEDVLRGLSGSEIMEVDSKNNVKSRMIKNSPVNGENLKLTIDYRLQNNLYNILSSLSADRGFQAGAAVMIDIKSGDILSLVSFPEFNSQILTRGGPPETIKNYFTDPRKPFLNRSISGLYAPGSIIKPIMAVAALNEKIISPLKQIFDEGSISIPNLYSPREESVFLDWKPHGLVDMEKAIAVSCNVYFFTIGGGYGDVAGLGIKKMKQYFSSFGLGEKTGFDFGEEPSGSIPDPVVKAQSSDPVWRIGDTYNASIGQGNFQTTPLQMALVVAAFANNGYLLKPEIVLDGKEKEPPRQIKINGKEIPREYFDIVKKGMRRAVLEGTAQGLSGLPVNIAAKTGTAELGTAKKFVNSWSIAFWPYENPRYAISIVLEKGSASNLIGSVYAMRQFMEWVSVNAKEYLKPD